MRPVKSFGILIEGYRGRVVDRGVIATIRMSRSGARLGWWCLSALESKLGIPGEGGGSRDPVIGKTVVDVKGISDGRNESGHSRSERDVAGPDR
jgi:hypothetical protein